MDHQIESRWRTWTGEPSPDNAQEYCEAILRVKGNPTPQSTTLGEVDLEVWCAGHGFGVAMPSLLERAFRLAFQCYGKGELLAELGSISRATFEQLGRLFTVANYRVLDSVGKRTVQAIVKLLGDHKVPMLAGSIGLAWEELTQGDEGPLDIVALSHEARSLRRSVESMRIQMRDLRRELGNERMRSKKPSGVPRG